jgi:MarR family transcriptional regulator, lower aerobic nicotinate degradation pathway regulator
MDVNDGRGRRRRAARPASLGRRPRSGFRIPPPDEGPALEYPRTLLRLPTAAMFLLMREMFRIGQERAAGATTPEEQMRFPHFAVLAALDEFGPASQRDISRRLRIDPSDLVAFVDWLEGVGFVERTRDEDDRRRYRVDLTTAGRRALAVRAAAADRANDELFRALDDHDRERLRELLLETLRGLERGRSDG